MKAVFYSDPLARRTPFGTGRYARHLMSAMLQIDPTMKINPWSAWTDCDTEGRKRLQEEYGWRKLPGIRKITASAWAFLHGPPMEWWIGRDHDLVHTLEVVYPVQTTKPLVATIHDLGPLTHPEWFRSVRPWLMEMGLKHVIRNADAIICVSAATADEFTGYFNVDLGDRLHVIHEGINPTFHETTEHPTLPEMKGFSPGETPYFMTMGAISPRKNLVRLIEAFEKVSDAIPHHWVHVGIAHWDATEFVDRLERSPIRDRIHLPGYLSDEQLLALYQGADAYVFPSLYEGFGLPILEAMAVGCPVLTSNVTSMPEIAGDAALLVDPHDVSSIAAGLVQICCDYEMQQELKKKGRGRSESFSWERCARETLAVYQQVLA